MRVAVSVGHNPDAPGARNGRHTEYSEMAVVAGLLVSWLSMAKHNAYLIGTGTLAEKAEQINRFSPDCAVELHLNAGGGSGCETLYHPGSAAGGELARHIQHALVSTCRFKDRGTKEGWYRLITPPDQRATPLYLLAATRCPMVIVEPFFLDSEGLFAENDDMHRRMARAVVKGLLGWWEVASRE